MRRILSAVAVLAILAGCGGGGGGDGGGSPEPTFRIPDDVASGFHNYAIGSTVVSVNGDVAENTVAAWIQAHDLESVFIIAASVTDDLSADVGAAFLDIDGDVSDVSDAVVLPVVSAADGMAFSDDGSTLSLDFTVVSPDGTSIDFRNSGSLISTSSTLPPRP